MLTRFKSISIVIATAVLLAGCGVVTRYFFRSTVEVTFADYHNILPAIEHLLTKGFTWQLLDFQNAGHFHPSLMAICLLNAKLFHTSISAEFYLCLGLVSAAFIFLVVQHSRSLAAQNLGQRWVRSSFFALGAGLILFNFNKWEHWTFPFTGIEYFLTTLFAPLLMWELTRWLNPAYRGTWLRAGLGILAFLLVVLAFSGGRGPILAATFGALGSLLLLKPDLFGTPTPRYRAALIVVIAVVVTLVYASLIHSASLDRNHSIKQFTLFFCNLYASWILGTGQLVKASEYMPTWTIGLIVLVVLAALILTQKKRDPFSSLLILFGLVGSLTITIVRYSLGADYSISSKYLPVLDLMVLGVLWGETHRVVTSLKWFKHGLQILVLGLVAWGYGKSFAEEERAGPHRQNLYTGLAKFFFAPNLYPEYAKYVSPDLEEAWDSTRIVRQYSIASAKRDDLVRITPFNIREGLAGNDGVFYQANAAKVVYFLYSRQPISELALGLRNKGSEARLVTWEVNGQKQEFTVEPGTKLITLPWTEKSAECLLLFPPEAHHDFQIFSFIQ